MPSSSKIAHASAGAMSANRPACSTSRMAWRSAGSSARGWSRSRLSQRVRQIRGGGGGGGQKPLRRREFPNHAASQPRDGGKRFSGAAGVGGGERPGARRPAGGRAIGGGISEIAGGTREDRGSRRGGRSGGAARRAHR